MAIFRFSGICKDPIPSLTEWTQKLSASAVCFTEIGSVDGTDISELSPDEAAAARKKIDAGRIELSALRTTIGQLRITEDFSAHKILLRRVCETAKILGAPVICVSAFRMPEDCPDVSVYRDEVISRLSEMADIAGEYGISLRLTEHPGTYVDCFERSADLLQACGGKLSGEMDPAAWRSASTALLSESFVPVAPYISAVRTNDVAPNGRVTRCGTGIGCYPEILAVLNRATEGVIILPVDMDQPMLRDAMESIAICLPRNVILR